METRTIWQLWLHRMKVKLVYSLASLAHRGVPVPLTQSLWSWILSMDMYSLNPCLMGSGNKFLFNKTSRLASGLNLMGGKQLLGFHTDAI